MEQNLFLPPANVHPADAALTDTRTDSCSRRTFLIGGTAAGIMTTLTAVQAQAAPLTNRSEAAILCPSSVGYWNPATKRVEAASGLQVAETDRLRNGVSLTVHGMCGDAHRLDIASFHLNAHFPVRGAAQGLRFRAWSFHQDSPHQVSSPVNFTMPVCPNEGLTLSIQRKANSSVRQSAAKVEPTEQLCRFSVAGGNGQPRLKAGVYFIALPDAHGDTRPNWENCRFQPKESEAVVAGGTLAQATLAGEVPVPFAYLMLSVQPANA